MSTATILPQVRVDPGLTDEELRTADQATRRWYLRVLKLANDTGCSIQHAIAAIEESDLQSEVSA